MPTLYKLKMWDGEKKKKLTPREVQQLADSYAEGSGIEDPEEKILYLLDGLFSTWFIIKEKGVNLGFGIVEPFEWFTGCDTDGEPGEILRAAELYDSDGWAVNIDQALKTLITYKYACLEVL